MKERLKKIVVMTLVLAMTVGLVACGSSSGGDASSSSGGTDNVVTVGVTDVLSSVNPLLMDATEVVKYALSLEFLPLVELNKDVEFEGMLASDITTEDNQVFTINLDPDAVWSDGEAVTSEDVLFTFRCWASPAIGNTSMNISLIEGTDDSGYVADDATDVSGIVAVDEKTVQITTKSQMSLDTFQNLYGRYMLILPQHVLGEVAMEDLASYDWFNSPTVVSGPYKITDVDLNHYVTYEANDKYFKGAPKIGNLAINVYEPSQILSGLQSGEIDVVQQTMANILQEDYESIRGLENVTSYDGAPVTTQSMFFNTETISNAKARQAILCAIDRENLVENFLGGNGEVVDGFVVSKSPYYDSSVTPTAYDLDKAKSLMAEAEAEGFDTSKEYSFYINSGDTTFSNVATYLVEQFKELGLTLKIQTVDINTLMTVAGERSFDLMAVQYTYSPVDVYTDASWLISADGWTGFDNEGVLTALAATQSTTDAAAITQAYKDLDVIMQQEVPMINAYTITALGATSNRVQNATPDVFGTFNNVQEWELQ